MKFLKIFSAIVANVIVILTACENESADGERAIIVPSEILIDGILFSECIPEQKSTSSNASISLKYTDNGMVKVNLKNTEFCCGTETIQIEDTIEGNQIVIDLIDEGPFTYCFCFHDVDFELGKFILEGRYQLLYIESMNSYSRDTFNIEFNYNSSLDTTVTMETKANSEFEPFNHEETILGGCNQETNKAEILGVYSDTIIFNAYSNSLDIFIGINYDCCYDFVTSSTFNEDTLLMQLNATSDMPCDCICFYTFDYIYSNFIRSIFSIKYL